MKIDLKSKGSLVWLGGIVVSGLIVGMGINGALQSSQHLVPVYVADKSIPVNTVVDPKAFTKKMYPQADVPSDAVKDPNIVAGHYTSMAIGKDAILQNIQVTDASTMRDVVRTYGLDFIGMTIPVDGNDIPLDQVNAGDTVDLLGIYGDQQKITSDYIAEAVPVLYVDANKNRLFVAVSRADAPTIGRDISAGKIRVLLDPRPSITTMNSEANQSNSSNANTSSNNQSSNNALDGKDNQALQAKASMTTATYRNGVVLLDEATSKAIQKVDADGTVTFKGAPGTEANLKANDIFVVASVKDLPYSGMAKKVISSTNSSGNIVIKTSEPKFTEVYNTIPTHTDSNSAPSSNQ